jgi:hypothetical protein
MISTQQWLALILHSAHGVRENQVTMALLSWISRPNRLQAHPDTYLIPSSTLIRINVAILDSTNGVRSGALAKLNGLRWTKPCDLFSSTRLPLSLNPNLQVKSELSVRTYNKARDAISSIPNPAHVRKLYDGGRMKVLCILLQCVGSSRSPLVDFLQQHLATA